MSLIDIQVGEGFEQIFTGELTSSEGMEHSFEVVELEDTPDTEHQAGPVRAC